MRPKCLAALALPAVGVVAAGSRQRKSRQPLAALDVPGGGAEEKFLSFLPESAGNQWKMTHVSKRNGHPKPFSHGFPMILGSTGNPPSKASTCCTLR